MLVRTIYIIGSFLITKHILISRKKKKIRSLFMPISHCCASLAIKYLGCMNFHSRWFTLGLKFWNFNLCKNKQVKRLHFLNQLQHYIAPYNGNWPKISQMLLFFLQISFLIQVVHSFNLH